MPGDNVHAADDMRKLRARFPRWGILKLTEQVEATARGEAGPDESDKTQTWRALRKHGRG